MSSRRRWVRYDDTIEAAISKLQSLLKSDYPISKRAIALLLLQQDQEIQNLVREKEGDYSLIDEIVRDAQAQYSYPLSYIIAMRRHQETDRIAARVLATHPRLKISLSERLSRVLINPLTGIPVLMIFLYFGLYQFVGVFGAGVVVDFIEGVIFEEYINPFITSIVAASIPYAPIQELIAGEYGIITLGVRYAVALILPIVGTFFLIFSLIEDVGYLPRLALLIDRVFKKIGLSGRAVIPMVLGFGCDTMATLVTRTQESRREKVITTLLLALAIPCSAQLGVILAILSVSPGAMMVWGVTIFATLLFIGYLASRILPGVPPTFYMEIPPLRVPKISNVLKKTYVRMEWYFLEVFPLFLLASILIWIGQLTGLFDLLISALEPLVNVIGLPKETAFVFLFGFFRRDYGAAGIFDLYRAGILSGIPLVVTAVTLTLFIPCIAQLSVMMKERGIKTALSIALFIFPFAFSVGFVLNSLLTLMGVQL